MDLPIPVRVSALAKDGEKLFILSGSGMIARTGDFTATLTDQPAVATISFNDQRWIASEGALLTAFLGVGLFLPDIIQLFGRKIEAVAGLYTCIAGLVLYLFVLRLRLR